MKKLIFLMMILSVVCFVSSSLAALEPPILSSSTDGLEMTLNWSTVPEATRYELYYAPVASYTGPESVLSKNLGASTSFNHTLWDRASFYIAVKAYNDQESSPYSNIEVVTIDADPALPTAPDLSVTTSGLNLTLSWNTVPDATGYLLSYAPSSSYTGTESFITKDMGGDTSFSAILWDEASFSVAVQAYNDQGSSSYSNIELFTIEYGNTMPSLFSTEWLNGKTLYQVWFGGGEDEQGNEIDNVPVVAKIEFGSNGIATITGLLNHSDISGPYGVTAAGALFFEDDITGQNVITCSTADYIATDYKINGVFDNVDLFFFEENAAMAYASGLNGMISPACNIDLTSLLSGQTFYITIYSEIGTLESWTFNAGVTRAVYQELVWSGVDGGDSGDIYVTIDGMTFTFEDIVYEGDPVVTFLVEEITADYLVISRVDGEPISPRLYFDRAKAEAFYQVSAQ